VSVLVATSNLHKIYEINAILSSFGLTVTAASSISALPEVVEDGDTFEKNAIKKAVESAAHIGRSLFAEDSGLEVLSLGGEPGVHSARYAGTDASDVDRMDKLLRNLRDFQDRSARFVCAIAFADPDGLIDTVYGEIRGVITPHPVGDNGFGYDPIFMPSGYAETFAELGSNTKNTISHRTVALQLAVSKGLFDRLDTKKD
jgi:XTP/dITP diphosphohydrolase